MNPQLYEQKRNELVNLINKTLVIENLPVSTRTPLEAIRKKVLENQFEITLVAEFQGGKTTTLNALCDGREIGPRGFGIKTSGCLLSAQNLSDPSASERAEITWRTKQQLVLGFAKLLKRSLAAKHPDRFQETQSAQDVSHTLDLDDDVDLALVRQLLDEEWYLYVKDKAGYSSDNLALLQVASLTVHFYDTADYRQLRSQTTWGVEDARKLMAFPTDFVQRWTKGNPSAFVLDEVAFVFIARVRCHIRSKNLARIGCVVTDCPGLFASAWDTAVAQDAMFNADGLWYLINGGKAIGLAACDMIRFVSERGWKDKLFYSVNLRDNTKDTILNRIVPADIAILNEIGMGTTKEELRSYHAALALRSVQARETLPGGAGLDDHTKKIILKDAAEAGCDSSSVDKAILSMIQDHLHALKVPARREVVDLDEKSVALAQEESQLVEIMGAIEQRAIGEKAFSILIHNGAAKVISALTECEGRLEDIEMAATKKRDAFEAEVREAQVKLDGFTKESEEAIASLKSVSVAPLADDLFDAVVKDSVDEVTEQSAYRIYHEVLKAWPVIQTLWSDEEKDKINVACGAVISEEFRKAVSLRLIRWMDGIKHGKNFSYNRTITDNVKRTNDRLHRRWHELDTQELLRKIHLPDVTGDPLLDNQLLIDAAKPDEPEDWTLADIIDLSYAGPALVAIVGIIAVLTLHPVGWIALAGGVVWAAIMSLVGKPLSSKVIDKIKPKLADGIKARLCDERQRIFDSNKGITAQASRFRDKYVHVFTNEIQKVRKKFEETVQAARITFEKSEAERLRIAQEAKECRENEIVPIRQEVKRFRDEVLPMVKTSSENSTAR